MPDWNMLVKSVCAAYFAQVVILLPGSSKEMNRWLLSYGQWSTLAYLVCSQYFLDHYNCLSSLEIKKANPVPEDPKQIA